MNNKVTPAAATTGAIAQSFTPSRESFLCWADFMDAPMGGPEDPEYAASVELHNKLEHWLTLDRRQLITELQNMHNEAQQVKWLSSYAAKKRGHVPNFATCRLSLLPVVPCGKEEFLDRMTEFGFMPTTERFAVAEDSFNPLFVAEDEMAKREGQTYKQVSTVQIGGVPYFGEARIIVLVRVLDTATGGMDFYVRPAGADTVAADEIGGYPEFLTKYGSRPTAARGEGYAKPPPGMHGRITKEL